jgi:hypothetical protein
VAIVNEARSALLGSTSGWSGHSCRAGSTEKLAGKAILYLTAIYI